MRESRYSFASPNFRINTDQSNPQNENSHERKSFKKSSKVDISNELSFKKPEKHFIFAQDQSQSDLQVLSTTQKHKNALRRMAPYSGKKAPLNQHAQNEKYSPQMIELLQNCKASIETLQQELNQKNLAFQKLQQERSSLQKKLIESQKQNQRTQQILNIYIKESKQRNSSQNNQVSHSKNPVQNEFRSQFQEIQKINDSLMKENEDLKKFNTRLQTEVNQLNAENHILNQKIHKMGKGVGKALSTIKKNKTLNEKISQFILVSERKPVSRLRQHGKILTHSKKDTSKAAQVQSFQTPTKANQLDTLPSSHNQKSGSFYETSEQRLADISRKVKRLDQLQKLEQILSKMQKLAEQDNQSSKDASH